MQNRHAVFEFTLLIVAMLFVSLSLETAGSRRICESYKVAHRFHRYTKPCTRLTVFTSVVSVQRYGISSCSHAVIHEESANSRGDNSGTEIAQEGSHNGATPIIINDNYKNKIPYSFMYKIARKSRVEKEVARHFSVRYPLSQESGIAHQDELFYLRV